MNFFISLGASILGALAGVLLAFRLDRWWERRHKKELAREAGQKILEEIDFNNTILRTVIDVLEVMPKELRRGGLGSRWFTPFARLRTRASRYAADRDLIAHVWKKRKIVPAEIQLGWYPEDCQGINIFLQRFEDDLRDFEIGKITEEHLLRRQSRLVNQLRKFLESSQKTYERFKDAAGLRLALEFQKEEG